MNDPKPGKPIFWVWFPHYKVRGGASSVFPAVHSSEHDFLKVLLERPGCCEQMSLGNVGSAKLKRSFCCGTFLSCANVRCDSSLESSSVQCGISCLCFNNTAEL